MAPPPPEHPHFSTGLRAGSYSGFHGPGPGSALDDFEEQLESCTRISAMDHRPFLLWSRMLQWFRSPPPCDESGTKGSNASRLLNAVYGTSDDEFPQESRNRLLQHMADDDDKCWLRTFIILLQIKWRNRDMGWFIGRLFEQDELDAKLPRRELDITATLVEADFHKPEAEEIASQFWKLQWQVCTHKAFHETYNQVYRYNEMILPITVNVDLKEGGQGAIFGIEVPTECIPPSLEKKIRRKPYTNYDSDGEAEGKYQQFALKVVQDRSMYDNETRAYQALETTDGVVQCLGWWEFQTSPNKTEYHLLLEWGSYDLADFFRLKPPPTTTEGILQFWKELFSIVHALGKIHRLKFPNYDETKTEKDGWHGDLKPGNILYCEEGEKRGWKIADPGFAKFIRTGRAEVRDGLPVAVIIGGTTTYGGPERAGGENNPVSQRFDVWSLGCVLSEAATWVVLGHRGVGVYRLVRKSLQSGPKDSKQSYSSEDGDDSDESDISLNRIRGRDRFHNGTDISASVKDWHAHLRHSIRISDPITAGILKLVEDHMLKGLEKDRLDAEMLGVEMRKLLDAAKIDTKRDISPNIGYKAPAYFSNAIKQEQHQEAKVIRDVLARQAKSVPFKYKSRPFIQASKEPLKGGVAGEEVDSILEYLPPPQNYSSTDSDMPLRSKRSSTEPSGSRRGRQFTLSENAENSHRKKPSANDNANLKFVDYLGARQLLEDRGWTSGTLEIPEDAASFEAPKEPLGTPQPQIHHRPTTPLLSPSTPTSPPPKSERSKRFSGGVASLLKERLGRLSSKGRPPILSSPEPARGPGELPALPESTTGVQGSQKHPKRKETQHSISQTHKSQYSNDTYLQDRDFVFLVDNSSSMAEHWIFARELLAVLSAFVYGYDTNGMELYFTSSRKPQGPFYEPKEFVSAMNRMRPRSAAADTQVQVPGEMDHGRTLPVQSIARSGTQSTASSTGESDGEDIRIVLNEVLNAWGKQYKKHLTVIILTDGMWPGVAKKRTVTNMIASFLDRQDKPTLKKELEERGLSFQFVSFGNNKEAIAELDYMDNNLTADGAALPDIIDHEPASGNVWKMILGSVDPVYDDTETQAGDDVSTLNWRHEESNGDEFYASDVVTDGTGSVKRTPSKGSKDIGHMGGAFDKPKHARTFHGR